MLEERGRDGVIVRRILVTGGAGFLGSHLCERLLADNCDVLCLDNFFTGHRGNVAHLLKNSHFELIRHDMRQPLSVEVDEIYNLACPASPIHYQHDPVRTLTTNVLGALNVLELGEKVGARVLQASTSEVYGDPLVHPQKENYHGNVSCTGPRACYDEGKRAAETLFCDFHRERGTDIRIARIFNTYGPRMLPNDGRVVSNFIVKALRGESITIYGDGSQTRSFCYVSDLIEGLVRLMSDDGPMTPVNLGNPEEFTIRQLAEEIVALCNSSSKIEYRPLPQDDPTRRRPDIGLAENHLRWRPRVDLKQGLGKTVDYFRRTLEKQS